MKIYRVIVIIIAIILGVGFGTLYFYGPATQRAIHDPITKEHYDMLRENALMIAKTLDKNAVEDDSLTADFYISDDKLFVIVESIKAKLTAEIPISNQEVKVEDDIMKWQGKAEVTKAYYQNENKLESKYFYIIVVIASGGGLIGFIYFILFGAWNLGKKNKEDK